MLGLLFFSLNICFYPFSFYVIALLDLGAQVQALCTLHGVSVGHEVKIVMSIPMDQDQEYNGQQVTSLSLSSKG